MHPAAYLLGQLEECIIALPSEVAGRCGWRGKVIDASPPVCGTQPTIQEPAFEALGHPWDVAVYNELDLLRIWHNPPGTPRIPSY